MARAATITPLRYRSRGDVTHRASLRRARGLLVPGRLNGDLQTHGYFAASACVGSPRRTVQLIVDTGSSLTAFPCGRCAHCGHHGGSLVGANGLELNTTLTEVQHTSTSIRNVSCEQLPPGVDHCKSCSSDGDICRYFSSYSEGSFITGHLVEDVFWFSVSRDRDGVSSHASPTGLPPPSMDVEPRSSDRSTSRDAHSSPELAVRATFGCQTFEYGLFYTQQADGIIGIGESSSLYGPTLFDYLRRTTGAPDMFSICLARDSGAMVHACEQFTRKDGRGAGYHNLILVPPWPKHRSLAASYPSPRARRLHRGSPL